jgi:hypothetical protein
MCNMHYFIVIWNTLAVHVILESHLCFHVYVPAIASK